MPTLPSPPPATPLLNKVIKYDYKWKRNMKTLNFNFLVKNCININIQFFQDSFAAMWSSWFHNSVYKTWCPSLAIFLLVFYSDVECCFCINGRVMHTEINEIIITYFWKLECMQTTFGFVSAGLNRMTFSSAVHLTAFRDLTISEFHISVCLSLQAGLITKFDTQKYR